MAFEDDTWDTPKYNENGPPVRMNIDPKALAMVDQALQEVGWLPSEENQNKETNNPETELNNPEIQTLNFNIFEAIRDNPGYLQSALKESLNPEYSSHVPKHLIQRARNARQKADDAEKHQNTSDVPSKPKDQMVSEFDEEMAAIIDMDSAEVCNLDAVAIRNLLVCKRKFNDGFGSYSGPLVEGQFKEVIFADGIFKAEQKGTPQQPRAIMHLAAQTFPRLDLQVWFDLDTEVIKRRFRKPLTRIIDASEVLKSAVYTIGMNTDGGYIPLLKSIKTANGCHVVFPDGAELDADSFNKPKILSTLREIIGDNKPELFATLLAELKSGSNSPLIQLAIREYADKFSGAQEPLLEIMRSAQQQIDSGKQKVDIQELQLRTDPESPELKTLHIIGQTKKGEYMIPMNGVNRPGVIRLGKEDFVSDQTGLETTRLTLYVGLDEKVYTRDQAVAYPRYVYEYDHFNTPNFYNVSLSGELKEADKDDMVQFLMLVMRVGVKFKERIPGEPLENFLHRQRS